MTGQTRAIQAKKRNQGQVGARCEDERYAAEAAMARTNNAALRGIFAAVPKGKASRTQRPSAALTPQLLAGLQRLAGNEAVCSLIAEPRVPAVQRCGPVPCDCAAEDGAEHPALQRQAAGDRVEPTVLQRQAAGPEACCQERLPGAIPIWWPSPNWHPSIGDPGSLRPEFNLPTDPLLIKRGSGLYDPSRPEIGRYDRIISGPPFNLVRPSGWPIHHKVPLMLGGWGDDAQAAGEYDASGNVLVAPNLVVMSPSAHDVWHRTLTQQPRGPRPGQGPSGTTTDGTRFCVLDLMPRNCERGREVPVPVPVPGKEEDWEERWELAKRRIHEALPWVVAVVVIGLLVACFATGVCEAAGLVAAVGAGAALIVIGILRELGIEVTGAEDVRA